MADPKNNTGSSIPMKDLDKVSGGNDDYAADGSVIPGSDADLKLGKTKEPPILPPIDPPVADGTTDPIDTTTPQTSAG